MTDPIPSTDRVSDERLAEILAWYVNWQPCAEDPGLSRMEADAISLFRELQRLRSPGGASELHGRQWAVFCDTCGATWSVQHYHAGKDRCEKCRNSSAEPSVIHKVPAAWDEHGKVIGWANPPAEPSAEPDAWMAEDGRVISGETKRGAVKDGGAIESGARPYCIPLYRRAPEPRDEPLPPCSTCGGETVPFCTSCGYTTTKPAEYPAYTECQHDHMKPNPTLRATYPKHGSQSGWVQEYRCNVCQCSFERPIATAGLRANGETP